MKESKKNEQDLDFVVLKLLNKKLTDLSARMDVAEAHIKGLQNMSGYLDPRAAEKLAVKEVAVKANEPILDIKEKQYLEAVIRPFSDKVKYVKKVTSGIHSESEFICIRLIGCIHDTASLPYFENGTMYKGMEPNKEYTLDELELFKEVWLTV